MRLRKGADRVRLPPVGQLVQVLCGGLGQGSAPRALQGVSFVEMLRMREQAPDVQGVPVFYAHERTIRSHSRGYEEWLHVFPATADCCKITVRFYPPVKEI